MAVNCSTRIKKMENQLFLCLSTFILLFFLKEFVLPPSFFPCNFSHVLQSLFSSLYLHAFFLGCFIFMLWTWSSPPHGFCFLSHVHMAHIQIVSGWWQWPSLLNWQITPSSRTSETRSTVCSWKWRRSPGSGEESAALLARCGQSTDARQPGGRGRPCSSHFHSVSAKCPSPELEFRKLHVHQHSPHLVSIFCYQRNRKLELKIPNK